MQSKLKITFGEKAVLADPDYLGNIIRACKKIVLKLGYLGQFISRFDIDFTSFDEGKTFGPTISVHVRVFESDVERGLHSTDFRFMGALGDVSEGDPRPSIHDIVEHLVSYLEVRIPGFVGENMLRIKAELETTLRVLAVWAHNQKPKKLKKK